MSSLFVAMQFIVDNPIFNLSCIRIQVSNFFLQKWVTVFSVVLGLFSAKGKNQSLTVKFKWNLRSKALPKGTKTAPVNLSHNTKYVGNLKETKADVYQKAQVLHPHKIKGKRGLKYPKGKMEVG